MLAFLVSTIILFAPVASEPSNLVDNFGMKTPYPMSYTDWKDVNKYAQVPDKCRLIHVRAVLRHGTRSYGTEEVQRVERAIQKMKAANAAPDEKSGGITSDQLAAIYAWQNYLNTNKDLLPRGFKEHAFLASEYYSMLDNLTTDSNMNRNKVQFETTSVKRAQQSGTAFRDEWASLLGSSNIPELIVNDTRNYFHKNCTAWIQNVDNNTQAKAEYDKGGSTTEAINLLWRISRIKLGMKTEQLTWEEVSAIYTVAAIETAAWGNASVLLTLFDDEDLAYLEYADDLGAYWQKTYSVDPVTRDMSCILTNHIFQTAEMAYENGPGASPSMFTFAHNEILMPIFGALNLFYDPRDGFKADASLYFYDTRHYDTSVLGKFASNVAFLFFHCSGESKPNDKMVLVLVNGRPYALPLACPFSLLCPLETIKSAYPTVTGSPEQCNYEKICWPSAKHDNAEKLMSNMLLMAFGLFAFQRL